MTELKTMKEWNPQKGDVFRFLCAPSGKLGAPRTFKGWKDVIKGSWDSEERRALRNGDEVFGKWELVRRAATVITMDKKWAQRKDPTKEVRVLCVDSGHSKSPVVYVDSSGFIFATAPEGYYLGRDREHLHDLVPLQEKTEDMWMILRNNGKFVANTFENKEACKRWLDMYGVIFYKPYKIVRMTEVEGEYYGH